MGNKFKKMFSFLNKKEDTPTKMEVAVNSESIYKQVEGFSLEEIKFIQSLINQPAVINDLIEQNDAKIRIIETLKGAITESEQLEEIEKGLNDLRANKKMMEEHRLIASTVTNKLNNLIDVIDIC